MSKPQIATVPPHDAYERDYARNIKVFSVSYMSNAKWYKVFQAIANAQLGITKATWKFIGSEHLSNDGVPALHDLLPSSLADGRFQPVEYKQIEWILFPRVWRPRADVGYEVSQDIEGLNRVLEAVGQFQAIEDDKGLTIFGYGKSA